MSQSCTMFSRNMILVDLVVAWKIILSQSSQSDPVIDGFYMNL